MGKYIEADLLITEFRDKCRGECACCMLDEKGDCRLLLESPSADVVEVVRCRDCVMWDDSFVLNGKRQCLNIGVCTDGNFYCGWGSKK